ncbi:MAG TPA: PIN domain-containing protein, partial [Pirellulales bacterium]
ETLIDLLGAPAFQLSQPQRIFDGLARVAAANVDFGDAYLAAAAIESCVPVASFDRDFDRFADVVRFEP